MQTPHTKCRQMQKLSANLLTEESMPDYSFNQSEADTILISAYAVLFTVGPLSLTQLTQINMWQQQLFHRNFLACSA